MNVGGVYLCELKCTQNAFTVRETAFFRCFKFLRCDVVSLLGTACVSSIFSIKARKLDVVFSCYLVICIIFLSCDEEFPSEDFHILSSLSEAQIYYHCYVLPM